MIEQMTIKIGNVKYQPVRYKTREASFRLENCPDYSGSELQLLQETATISVIEEEKAKLESDEYHFIRLGHWDLLKDYCTFVRSIEFIVLKRLGND